MILIFGKRCFWIGKTTALNFLLQYYNFFLLFRCYGIKSTNFGANFKKMIQRIQSLYLFAGIVLSIAVMFSGIFFVSNGTDNMVLGAFGVQEGNLVIDLPPMIPLVVIAGIMIAIQVFAISQFKKRKLQVNLVKLNILFAIIIMGWIGFIYYSILQLDVSVTPFVGVFHTPLILFSSVLALRGINRDEALVKSVDRLR